MSDKDRSVFSDTIVLIPALNEEKGLKKVLNEIPVPASAIVVIDNGSTDNTKKIAVDCGCHVVSEPRKGYGYACLAGIRYLTELEVKPKYVMFLDADGADDPRDLIQIYTEKQKRAHPSLLIGARFKGLQPGAMSVHSILANKILVKLINFLYRSKLSDLGPLRIIDYDLLVKLDMQDTGYGWASEMIVKTLKNNIPVEEIDVRYRQRVGVSKISGSFVTSMKAAIWLTIHILRHYLIR